MLEATYRRRAVDFAIALRPINKGWGGAKMLYCLFFPPWGQAVDGSSLLVGTSLLPNPGIYSCSFLVGTATTMVRVTRTAHLVGYE